MLSFFANLVHPAPPPPSPPPPSYMPTPPPEPIETLIDNYARSQNIPLPPISDNLFDLALRANYVYSPPPVPSPPLKNEAASRRAAMAVDWSIPRRPEWAEQEREPLEQEDLLEDVTMADKAYYEPNRCWAWASRQPVRNKIMRGAVHAGDDISRKQRHALCDARFVQVNIGTQTLTLVNKNWARVRKAACEGFDYELELFRSPSHLLPLQGDLVPRLITTDNTLFGPSMYMEPPHHIFWMHASTSMPDTLKRRVIQAYMSLHRHGILHGAVELRHILIGADGRVTLTDFKCARSTRLVASYDASKCRKRDFALELREVKCKLDYQDARARESAKWARFSQIHEVNQHISRLHDLAAAGKWTGHIGDFMEQRPQDKEEPPLPPKRRVYPKDKPLRFVYVHASRKALTAAISSFYGLLRKMEEEDAAAATSPIIPLPTPPMPVTPISRVLDLGDPATSSRARKRKRSIDAGDSGPPAKRHQDGRGEADTQVEFDGVLTLEYTIEENTTRVASSASDTPFAPPSPPAETRSLTDISYSSTIYYSECDGELPPAQPLTVTDEPSPPKVLDFAKEPYDGPRGFYVPHPPTESDASVRRVVHIRNKNHRACTAQGLPYRTCDRNFLTYPFYKRYRVAGELTSLGELKRKRDQDAEGYPPPSKEVLARRKKQRFDADRAAYLSEYHTVRFDDKVGVSAAPSDHRAPLPARPAGHRSRRATPARGILKHTPPVKTVSYDHMLWQEPEDRLYSPKLGPLKLLPSDVPEHPPLFYRDRDDLQDQVDAGLGLGVAAAASGSIVISDAIPADTDDDVSEAEPRADDGRGAGEVSPHHGEAGEVAGGGQGPSRRRRLGNRETSRAEAEEEQEAAEVEAMCLLPRP